MDDFGCGWKLKESVGKSGETDYITSAEIWTFLDMDGIWWRPMEPDYLTSAKILERHGNSRTGHIWKVGGIVWNSHLTISSITSLLRSLELGSAKPQKCIYSPPFPSFINHRTQHSYYLFIKQSTTPSNPNITSIIFFWQLLEYYIETNTINCFQSYLPSAV